MELYACVYLEARVENMAFEVLLEIDQSRKEVFITAETASATIKENLPSTDVLLAPFDKLGSEEKKAVYVLQKWSEKWSEYVDVKEVTELKDGDKLSVYLRKETVSFSLCCMHFT